MLLLGGHNVIERCVINAAARRPQYNIEMCNKMLLLGGHKVI